MDEDLRRRAIALYDRFTHDHGNRRAFMRDMVALTGSVAAAEMLAGSIAASPAAAAIVPPDDKRLKTSNIHWTVAPGRELHGYMALPAKARGHQPAVMVVHENRGLTDHIRDVARRVALAGFVACAPDFLSGVGGTPADEDQARAMIGKLDLAQTTADAVGTVRWLGGNAFATGKVGAIGFCWGGALVNRTAVAAGSALTAAVPYYGPAPDPSEAIKVKAAMLLHYGALDDRVNATGRPWVAALQAAGVPAQAYFYEGANHAFNNDTSAERYDPAAAKLAWERTIAFLKERLA
ncbi:dienelactone hydrolase family protein [Sphingomonas nostoxanthinifaciens]|uniref:dienelactone hydrolase family protein n=1 Tax=Sphingomonas nostoxanthinifaciens TaxID=2872652 RepID=UPI001CC20E27|nr:dienelactone hydrolase family protein [Sphingomonas nostoxanthinifaciens]UAK23995.1 dienelactone hydrolase family protein [Sphingomonas nostoxanthinifaciens]